MNIYPILPKKIINKCIIGEKFACENKDLTDLGIECVTFSPSSCLDDEISAHADIHCFNCGNKTLIASAETAGELRSKLLDYTVLPCENIHSPYPDDVKLNAALTPKGLICNSDYISDIIKSFCNKNSIQIIHTKQGYAKCSVLIISENAVITEDVGIAYLLKKYQFDVLHINAGYIRLSDNHYGFIGGAAGMISENILYVSGDLSHHPDYNMISEFLNKYGIKPVFNKERPLNDFGGFIPL